MELFHYQAKHVPVYAKYLSLLNKKPEQITSIDDIPFMPVQFFKTHQVLANGREAEITFESSSTSGTGVSKHGVADVRLYMDSFINCFTHFYGNPGDYCFLCLLPSYLERESSSLVYMCNELIKRSNHTASGFYLDNYKTLASVLKEMNSKGVNTILLGVTYALLDLAEQFPQTLENVIIMETGGMKGKRQELLREQVHRQLQQAFGCSTIHSEYGMTELLSQAYSSGLGKFKCPPWMHVLTYQLNDPFTKCKPEETGGIQIIDLANVYSCAFLQTQDIGKIHYDNTFEILGRLEYSDLRGCNLMIN
ncbi:MAG: acyl transferase [Bacteroidetes bacterium]|nr:acyl transferase [Bacteroidota bacterium]